MLLADARVEMGRTNDLGLSLWTTDEGAEPDCPILAMGSTPAGRGCTHLRHSCATGLRAKRPCGHCDRNRRDPAARGGSSRDACEESREPCSICATGISGVTSTSLVCAEAETVAARVLARKLQMLPTEESPLPRGAGAPTGHRRVARPEQCGSTPIRRVAPPGKSDAKCRCDDGPVREVGAPVTEPANTPSRRPQLRDTRPE
jgi:hypothetical protein